MGGCIISRDPDGCAVCKKYVEEWAHIGTVELDEGVYAHFCRAIDDWEGFEWNVTIHDETISKGEFAKYRKLLPKSFPPVDLGVDEYEWEENDDWDSWDELEGREVIYDE